VESEEGFVTVMIESQFSKVVCTRESSTVVGWQRLHLPSCILQAWLLIGGIGN
jgi:hypothetical protein